MPIKINGSTSGSVTLAAPATGSDVTVTLPAAAGTLAMLASPAFTGTPTVNGLGLGKVLQIVSASTTTQTSTTSSTFVTTGLSASITPTSSTSKILILASTAYTASSSGAGAITIFRGTVSGTNLGDATYGFASLSAIGFPLTLTYVDSPATTSATTYTLGFRMYSGTGPIYAQNNSSPGSMVLMEIQT